MWTDGHEMEKSIWRQSQKYALSQAELGGSQSMEGMSLGPFGRLELNH